MNTNIQVQAIAAGSPRGVWSSNATNGRDGYLFEVGGFGPFATQILVQEAFLCPSQPVRIPAATLRARLADTIAVFSIYLRHLNPNLPDDGVEMMLNEYRDFVAFCEQLEQKTGEETAIVLSEVDYDV